MKSKYRKMILQSSKGNFGIPLEAISLWNEWGTHTNVAPGTSRGAETLQLSVN